jgi:hypothetical protein
LEPGAADRCDCAQENQQIATWKTKRAGHDTDTPDGVI